MICCDCSVFWQPLLQASNGHLKQIAARRWYFLTALQPITCQKHKHTCVDTQHASPAQQLQPNTTTVLPRFTSPYAHTTVLSLQMSWQMHASLQSEYCCANIVSWYSKVGPPYSKALLLMCLSYACVGFCYMHLDYVCGSAACVVAYLYLQSETYTSI